MMDFFAVRAMEISRLSEDQLNSLHRRETERMYYIPSWNIQTLFGLESLKDTFGIPADPEACSTHIKKIGHFLKEENLLSSVDEGLFAKNIDAIHSFDWGIWKRHLTQEFYYSGGSRKGRSLRNSVIKESQSFLSPTETD